MSPCGTCCSVPGTMPPLCLDRSCRCHWYEDGGEIYGWRDRYKVLNLGLDRVVTRL